MLPSRVLQLAKQGDPTAIAALINQALQPRGVIVQGGMKDGHLQLLVKAKDVPDPGQLVPFLYQGLVKLQPGAIKMVKIYGQGANNNYVAWRRAIQLPVSETQDSKPRSVSTVEHNAADSTHRRSPSTGFHKHHPLLNRQRRVVRQRAWQRFLCSLAAGVLATGIGVPLLVSIIHLLEHR